MIRMLFGFQGRINRAQYWAGSLISGFVAIFLIVALMTLSAAGASSKEFAGDPKAALAHLGGGVLGIMAIVFALAWVALALQVKRFHDRGKSGWFAAIPLGLGGFVGFVMVASPLALIGLAPIIGLAMIGVNIWFLVELGCLPGGAAPNQFGNPPGGGVGGVGGVGGAPSSAPSSPFDAKPQPTSLQTAEAAMERAIAERSRQPAAQRQPATAPPRAEPAMAAAGARPAAPTSFGRRPAR